MCSYCNEEDYSFDPNSGIVYEEEFNQYNLRVETSCYEEYYGDYLIESVSVNYCPKCGRNLYNNQQEKELYKVATRMIEEKKEEILVIVAEELSELIQATSKLKRGKPDHDNLAEEIADVIICLEVVKQLSKLSEQEIQKWLKFKLERATQKIKEGTFK